MESNAEDIHEYDAGNETAATPPAEPIPETEPPSPDVEIEPAAKPEGAEAKRPLWMPMLISVWIIGIYITFYYFLAAHWGVRYTIER